MGMGIAGRRFAMGRPSGMGDAYTARDILVFAISLQVGDLPLGFVYTQVAVVIDQCHASGVVSPIFQSFESFQ